MSDGLTAENMAQIEQIKAMATTPEDEAAIEEFIAKNIIEEIRQEKTRTQNSGANFVERL